MTRVLPRFVEPLPIEFYRHDGKLRTYTIGILLTLNWLALLGTAPGYLDFSLSLRVNLVNSALLVADIALGLVMWRGRIGLATLRLLMTAGLVCELLSTTLQGWAHGMVSSHMPIFYVAIVVLYRAGVGFRDGVLAWLGSVVCIWSV